MRGNSQSPAKDDKVKAAEKALKENADIAKGN